jgi:hypothetical protein
MLHRCGLKEEQLSWSPSGQSNVQKVAGADACEQPRIILVGGHETLDTKKILGEHILHAHEPKTAHECRAEYQTKLMLGDASVGFAGFRKRVA